MWILVWVGAMGGPKEGQNGCPLGLLVALRGWDELDSGRRAVLNATELYN